MRRKRSRLQEYSVRNRNTTKDKEGVPVETYGDAFLIAAEVWPAGGKVQAEVYGERLAYIQNCRIAGKYTMRQEDGQTVYVLENGSLKEQDGICFRVSGEEKPDYRIIAIRPYNELYLEMERRP